jgi:predicted XRE-type DNA-binding protein
LKKEKVKHIDRNDPTTGSGDVFIDLGFREDKAAVLNIRSYLLMTLRQAIREALKNSKQDEIAKAMRVDQPIISKILNDRTIGFSIERIIMYLSRLDYDIHIHAEPSPEDQNGGRVIDS